MIVEHVLVTVGVPVAVSVGVLFLNLYLKSSLLPIMAIGVASAAAFFLEVGFDKVVPDSSWHFLPWAACISSSSLFFCKTFEKKSKSIHLRQIFFKKCFFIESLVRDFQEGMIFLLCLFFSICWQIPKVSFVTQMILFSFVALYLVFLKRFTANYVERHYSGAEWCSAVFIGLGLMSFLAFRGHFAKLSIILIATSMSSMAVFVLISIFRSKCDYESGALFGVVFAVSVALIAWSFNYGQIPAVAYILGALSSCAPGISVFIKSYKSRILVSTFLSFVFAVCSALIVFLNAPVENVY